MKRYIEKFIDQIEEAIVIGDNASDVKRFPNASNIIVSGLGGSGFGANLVRELVAEDLRIPMTVNKGYFLPKFADENTFVIISSYSGNTEETLNVMKEAIDASCFINCISSGGEVQQLCKDHHINLIQIPPGMPPRSCLGYSFVQQLFYLHYNNFIDPAHIDSLRELPSFLRSEEEDIKSMAKGLAEDLYNKIPAIYCADSCESIAIRYRQQFNENAKMLCWHHVIPEMNHNELVGWRNVSKDVAVLLLRNDDDFDRIQQRMEINKSVFNKETNSIFEIHSKGKNRLHKYLYLILFGDWLSYYLAEKRGMDSIEVDVIEDMKSKLANLKWA